MSVMNLLNMYQIRKIIAMYHHHGGEFRQYLCIQITDCET